jgi:hypothetical protein
LDSGKISEFIGIVPEGSGVGPLWAHLTEACVGLKGSVLATWARRTKPLRPSQPAQRGNPKGIFQKEEGNLPPTPSPWAAALGLGGGAKLAAQPPI